MEFSDIYLNSEEFFEILRDAWEKSEFFDGWDRRWHPEDLTTNFEVVFDGVTQGITAYSHIIGKNVRSKTPYDANKKTVDDMIIQKSANADRVQVFGGTIPEYSDKRRTNVPATYTGNTFGDNV